MSLDTSLVEIHELSLPLLRACSNAIEQVKVVMRLCHSPQLPTMLNTEVLDLDSIWYVYSCSEIFATWKYA